MVFVISVSTYIGTNYVGTKAKYNELTNVTKNVKE